MKLFLFVSLFVSSLAFSQTETKPSVPSFGAFTYKNYLYVTYLTDCNTLSVDVNISTTCHKDRMSRNLAIVCGAELAVASTRMICPDEAKVPKVYTFDLASLPIAGESKVLSLKHDTEVVRVKLNKE